MNNLQTAITDLQFVVKQLDNEQLRSRRQAWLNALKAGKNPPIKELIETLKAIE